MHASLLFSPGTDPRSPHLALPSLAAFLRGAGVHVSMRDVDLESFLWLIQPAQVSSALDACQRRFDRATATADERLRLRALLDDGGAVVEHIGAAPGQLREPSSFYDPFEHHAARRWIRAALEITSAASDDLVDYGIEPPRYDVRDASVMRMRDLAHVTSRPETNLFETYYESSVLADLDRERPDVVAVSILNLQQVIPGLTLARRLKDRGHFVVIGGTVYTKFVGELLGRPEFFELFCNGVIAYEGESALLELLQQVTGPRDFSQVPNFLYVDKAGRVAFTRYHVEDVSALPTPDFDGLPLADYLAPAPCCPSCSARAATSTAASSATFLTSITSRRRRTESAVLSKWQPTSPYSPALWGSPLRDHRRSARSETAPSPCRRARRPPGGGCTFCRLRPSGARLYPRRLPPCP